MLCLILIVNMLVLGYRVVAAVDAWRVANFLNRLDGTGATRVGSGRLALRAGVRRRACWPSCSS